MEQFLNKNKINKRTVNGVLILDKPKGISSNGALQKVKRLFNAKKAGHTGSLDPLATGVLPICFGTATKLCQNLLDSDKKYLVKSQLGVITATGDAEGEVIKQMDTAELTSLLLGQENRVKEVIESFIGPQEQVPSMYSALKHNGVPLYKLARQGITIERKSRSINIYHIKIINIDLIKYTIELEVACSKGTYIRTLVEDIGNKIGCGAYVLELRRISAGPYHLDNPKIVTIESLESLEKSSDVNNLLDGFLL